MSQVKTEPVFDYVHPSHQGPNSVHMTRVAVAELVAQAGHRLVLDLPAGTGALTQLLLDRGIEVVSADLCPEGFVVPGRICLQADLNERLPLESDRFDAMVCVEGIEHIENPHLLAREAHRVLKAGGCLYVSTPNVLSIRSRLSYLWRGYPDQFHYMIEVDPRTGEERPIAHINPVGFLELRYVLSRWGFHVERVETNRRLKAGSPFYALLRRLMATKGGRAARSHERIARVREMLLSTTLLYGETLIVVATKAARS